MINHARTLLLNRPTTSLRSSRAGAEYVDPSFRAVELSAPAQQLRAALLGSVGDELFENRSLAQLLQAVHSFSVTRDFILRPDSRITYRFDGLVPVEPEWEVHRVSGSGMPTLSGELKETAQGLCAVEGVLSRSGDKISLVSPTFSHKATGIKLSVLGANIRARSEGEWRVRAVARSGCRIPEIIAAVDKLPKACDSFLRAGDSDMLELWLRGQTQVSRVAGLVCLYLSRISGEFNG